MLEDKKPEGVQTPTKEWGDLNELVALSTIVSKDRNQLRDALKRLDAELTHSFAGAGVEVAYLAWSIQKHHYGGSSWWGIWYCPPEADNNSGDPEDRFNFYPLKTIGDAPHADLMAFAEKDGAELMRRYMVALREKSLQIRADVNRIQIVLAALQPLIPSPKLLNTQGQVNIIPI